MARTNEKVTPQELKTFEKFFAENPQWDTVANGDSFSTYLLETWQVDITPDTLAVAARQLSEAGRLEVLTPAHIQYLRVAKQDPNAAQRVSDWYARQNILVKDDQEKALENQAALLSELRGREINSTNIQLAMGRVGHRNGLHYVQASRRVDPRKHQDSGSFMSREDTNVTMAERARRDRERQEVNRPKTETPVEPPDAWKTLAENLRGATHSETEALKSINGPSWRETYTLRKKYLTRREGRQFNRTAV